MSYRNYIERELYELRRCGCRQCYERYEEIMHRRNREERRYMIEYTPRIEMTGVYTKPNSVLATAVDYVKEKPVEEPKNLAVKMLVDKLKIEQNTLKSTQITIDNFKKNLNEYNKQKLSTNKNIKELSDALKKLGHKNA